jgi:ParB family chromosome partitioning protein
MPTINELNTNKKKSFKKREYRPYDPEGNQLNQLTEVALVSNNSLLHNIVLEITPDKIRNWEFNDRPESELGDIELLAQEFLTIGQKIPCIVRKVHNDPIIQYELIAGERRWRAAQKAKLPLKILVQNLSDNEAAMVQISENSHRTSLSDYAKGLNYSKLIEKNILSQSDLVDKLKISKQQVSRLLSFTKIPSEIIDAIGDMSKVSARTAEQIKQLCAKGRDYTNAILHAAAQISEGKIGKTKLLEVVQNHINNTVASTSSEKINSINGRHLYTWRKDSNSTYSMHFPKNIALLITAGKLEKTKILNAFQELLEDLLMNIK